MKHKLIRIMNKNNLPTNLLDRLCYLEGNKDWDGLLNNLQPKSFLKTERSHAGRKVVSKLAELLTKPGLVIPNNVTIIIMKCLTNVCISCHDVENNQNYLHKAIDMTKMNPNLKLNWNKIYEALSMHNIGELQDKLLMECLMEYPETSFPYDGLIQWIINQLNIITSSNNIITQQWDIMKISFSFLCNISAAVNQDLPDSIYDPQLKIIIMKLLALDFNTTEKIASARRICCFIYNIMKMTNLYYMPEDSVVFVRGLLKADQLGINIAQDILLLLMNTQQFVQDIYETLPTELKLYMLEVLYQNLKSTVYDSANNENVYNPSNDIIEFLADRFKKKSDLILKTVNTYVNGMEPVEITIIIDILGLLTTAKFSHITLQNDTSLLINTVYLLRALHMTGKEANNCFTPVQKLSEIAPSTADSTENATTDENIQNHPGFGFKAALIRVIGNLVFRNKKNQDMVRDIDGIPLLLDCSNIDARNPLIMQWTILAIRNLCEGNKEIQQLIDSSQKIKHIDNKIVQEFGIKLNENEDGNAIGIVPLPSTNSG